MLAIALFFGTILLIGTAIISGMIGWVLREYMFYHHDRHNQAITSHPEMYDEDGNLIPTELLALRFDPTLDLEDEED
tara:strand:+ start:151 stop:381 length:231 start_codon:yes stop_codon:yes gene_type:complete